MKRILFILGLAIAVTTGFVPTLSAQTVKSDRASVTMPGITYIVPLDDGLVHQQGLIEDLVFRDSSRYGYSKQTQEKSKWLGNYTNTINIGDAIDTISSKRISDSTLMVERRLQDTTNAAFFSGKRYNVNITDIRTPTDYKVTLQPVNSDAYQAKIIFPLPVPDFNENDLQHYLLDTKIHYKYEVNSPFNSESTHANFVRLLKSSSFREGEKDPVTGKIFKQQFILPYRDQEVFFTLETFPYRNGSKAVMYLRIPATLTSPNTVDYKIMLDDIKAALNKIVQS